MRTVDTIMKKRDGHALEREEIVAFVAGVTDEQITAAVREVFSFKPADIVSSLNLLRPIYRETTNYGHFGKNSLPWEKTNKAAALKAAIK